MRQLSKGFGITAVVLVVITVVVILAVLIRILNANRSTQDQPSSDSISDNSLDASQPLSGLKGVSISPLSYEAQDFTAFFEEAGLHNDLISWAGPWSDIDPDNSPPATVAALADANDYRLMIITSTHGESNGTIAPIKPMTEANKQSFIETLASFAQAHEPPFVGIGNEVNRIYDHDKQEYRQFVEWFEAAAQAVKQASPESQVFTVFQYENMNGLNGGLFGGSNDESDTDWQLLSDFESADFLAFTTYPYLIYQTPSEIPENYYTRIKNHTDKPVAFTEVGWPSVDTTAGWPSSAQEQTLFVERFDKLSDQLDMVFATWPFLYDQAFGVPFNDIGLIDSSGQSKPAYEAWKNASF